ncbi:transmembrane protein [Mycobacterium tuberculosis]|nr:transmembrane protein [Mycobacterium tuberculosis]
MDTKGPTHHPMPGRKMVAGLIPDARPGRTHRAGRKPPAPRAGPRPSATNPVATKKGPVAPAPMTAAQARARRKSLAGPKLSREERRAEKAANRARMTERRERMMAGEEAYLLPRDRGPVRRYVRDVVDSRRNLLGLFMPSALTLLFVMFAVPQVQFYLSPAMLILLALMTIDAIILGRKVGRLVDTKFPSNTESRWRLGLYAAGRASQIRRLRAPRPQVERGGDVG